MDKGFPDRTDRADFGYVAPLRLDRRYFEADRKWLGPAASAQRPGVQALLAPFIDPP